MHRTARKIAIAAFAVLVASPAMTQALDDRTQHAIIGADVKQEEATASAKEDKVMAAIDRTAENIGTVRKTSAADRVDIVFLSDAARESGGMPPKIGDSLKKHESDITRLRKEIEANALLFHAIDSHRVLMQDVVALDFEPSGHIVVYAAARPAP